MGELIICVVMRRVFPSLIVRIGILRGFGIMKISLGNGNLSSCVFHFIGILLGISITDARDHSNLP